MPIVKENLILGDGSVLDPVKGEPFIRLARVEQVNLFSQDMIVQFLDGDYDPETELPLEGPEDAVAVIGSPVPETTYNPSCTVYGKGDLVNVLVGLQGTNYVVSLMDYYIDVNRENFALCEGWALYDILNGTLVDFLDDDENSYITFRSRAVNEFLTYDVTKITGDPNKRYVFRKILDYFTKEMTQIMQTTAIDNPAWEWDVQKAGPDNNPQRHKHGRMHQGRRVCGFPYVEDIDYASASLDNDLTLYDPVLTGLKQGDNHPLNAGAEILRRFHEGATVVWFDEEEPTHVLVIGSYPAWDGCKKIVFAEVPVYSMAGRKFLEREIVDEDLPTEERNVVQSWQRFSDQVRILHTIDRSTYVDFASHANNIEWSERLYKAVTAYLPTQAGEIRDFGILDGYGWAQSPNVYDISKLKKFEGTIERSIKPPGPEGVPVPEANGSIYDYEIIHNDPLTTGNIDLWYSTRFRYEYNGGARWEQQTSNTPLREYNCYTDGVNSMERTIEFDFYCNGFYPDPEDYMTGRISWSDAGNGFASNGQDIHNTFTKKTFRNGGLLFTDSYVFDKAGNTQYADSTRYIMMYGDVEYDLFVFLKQEIHIASHLGIGPGWQFIETLGTHWQRDTCLVIFEGVEWTIWTYFIPLTEFPAILNFFPWLLDLSNPEMPEFGPYSIDTNYNGGFCHDPTLYYWNGTLRPGYSTSGYHYPTPLFSPESLPCWQAIFTHDTPNCWADPDDLLQVSVDMENDSFCVIAESFYVTDTLNSKVLTYPNGGNALYSFNGELPHYVEPEVTGTIEL